ncbi:MAG: M28 family peptidase [Blastocatellia bacterium]
MNRINLFFLSLFMLFGNCAGQAQAPSTATKISAENQAVLDRISADSLRGHLSFIASDLLEGRATPSRGLDIAAEYIAAQFRRAGLEPVGDNGYFQTATFTPKDAKPEDAIKLRNVIGLLRGSDPVLKDTYILVTAHYDHIGINPNAKGDQIFNGANDDGSGTVSVMELAAALAKREPRPKRSIVFMTVFGEERGLVGSRYYGQHPIFPLEKTVAGINLEQVGRTDDSEGSQVNRASLTGYDFSDLGEILRQAGEATGITVFKHPKNSDAFFGRSDNQALADQGIPSHTLCVAFVYPDYHGLGDHWDKIDYDNLTRTNRMRALGLLMLADNPVAPKWNEANPKTQRYVEAWKKQQGK